MHHTLKISEILTMILRAVPHESMLTTAAAVAATCRTLYEPATDVVWEDLPSLDPLFAHLPKKLLSSCNYRISVARKQGAAQWARFLTFAARVKTLRVGYKALRHAEELEEELRTIVAMRASLSSPIFPRLDTLILGWYFTTKERNFDAYIPLFIGPRVNTVQIQAAVPEILRQLVISNAPLRHLEISHCYADDIRLILHFETLETIRSNSIYDDEAPLELLAYLPSLQHLSTELPGNFPPLVDQMDSAIAFPALQSLTLTAIRDSEALVNLLQSITSPELHTLHLEVDEFFDDDQISDLNEGLASLQRFSHLRSLHLTGCCAAPAERFPPESILKLSGLEELELSCCAITLSREGIVELGRNLPRLRRLTIPGDVELPCWSFDALADFAAHLPRLEYLYTDFDLMTPSAQSPAQAISAVPITLVIDSQTELRETDREWVAACISRTYPNAVCRLWHSKEKDEDLCPSDRHWLEVGRLVKQMRAAHLS